MAARARRLPEVEVLEVGTHKGELYTLSDLRDMVRNFRLCKPVLDPPVYIGHENRQPLLAGVVENTGEPAVGWVDSLWVENRQDRAGKRRWALLASLSELHPLIARLIDGRAYRKVSAEVYPPDYPHEGLPPGVKGMVFRRLALVGGDLPAVKTLRDLPVTTLSERAWLWRHAEGKMDREQMTQVLLDAGWSQAEIDAVTDDAVLGVIVAHEMRAATGGGAAPPAAANADAPMPGVGGLPDRATMTSDLVAAGHDQAELDALSDADLALMWQQEIGSANMSETPPGTQAAATPTPPVTTPPATVPARPAVAAFAEQVLKIVLPRVNSATAGVRRDVAQRRRDDRLQRFETFAEEMRGFVPAVFTPADWDEKSGLYNLYKQGRAAALRPRVVKLGEKDVDELEALIAACRVRTKGKTPRRFAERIPDPQNAGQASRFDQIREAVRKQYGTQATAGRSLEERLRLLPPVGLC